MNVVMVVLNALTVGSDLDDCSQSAFLVAAFIVGGVEFVFEVRIRHPVLHHVAGTATRRSLSGLQKLRLLKV